MLFSLLKHYLDTDTALKASQSVYCLTTFISHSVENYFPRLWGMGISDAILLFEEPLFILIIFIKPHCIFVLKKLHLAVFMGEMLSTPCTAQLLKFMTYPSSSLACFTILLLFIIIISNCSIYFSISTDY